MTAITQKHCAGCYHYFENDGDQAKGICKLNPPSAFPVQTVDALQQPQLTVLSLPVNVTANDWCGCWMSRQFELEFEQAS
jgi:hypothetical protein